MIERKRKDVMQHMLKENIGLIFHKREELQIPYTHFMVTDKIIEHGDYPQKQLAILHLFIFIQK